MFTAWSTVFPFLLSLLQRAFCLSLSLCPLYPPRRIYYAVIFPSLVLLCLQQLCVIFSTYASLLLIIAAFIYGLPASFALRFSAMFIPTLCYSV